MQNILVLGTKTYSTLNSNGSGGIVWTNYPVSPHHPQVIRAIAILIHRESILFNSSILGVQPHTAGLTVKILDHDTVTAGHYNKNRVKLYGVLKTHNLLLSRCQEDGRQQRHQRA